MKVVKAKHYGFCSGVRNAVDTAFSQEAGAKLIGPIVHNKQILSKLEEKGIYVVDSVEDVKEGQVIFRAHGVPLSDYEKASEKKLEIVDCTCPNVSRIHNLSRKLEGKGYNVIILGEKDHPEVKGIISRLKEPTVIKSRDELETLTFDKEAKYALLSQTTMPEEEYLKTERYLKEMGLHTRCYNTICKATQLRQTAAEELAKNVDMMIVVGGYKSNNTLNLAKLCKKIVETKHIEIAEEVEDSWFAGKKVIGITAGASTPDFIINEVISKIKKI